MPEKCPVCRKDIKRPNGKYCSRECYLKARWPNGEEIRTCKICGKKYPARSNGKIYCSMKCYCDDTERRKLIGLTQRKRVKHECAECGEKLEIHLCRSKGSKRHFCDRTCYRLWLSKRFDYYIATKIDLKEVNNFDEFLSQENLPCLVEGCDWVGKHLANHMRIEHGIPASYVKKLAGFNRQTGLVGSELHKQLSSMAKERSKDLDHIFTDGHEHLCVDSYRPYRSEAREHYLKGMIAYKELNIGEKK